MILDEFQVVDEQPAKSAMEKNKKKKKVSSKITASSRSRDSQRRLFKAPVPGDHVVSLHQNWAYFMATVVEFDPTDLVYTVDWDDGDSSGRVQSYQVGYMCHIALIFVEINKCQMAC